MPYLAGAPLVDASGNHLIDGSANALGEAGVQVVVINGQMLAAGPNPPGWGDLVSLFVNAIQTSTMGDQIDFLYENVGLDYVGPGELASIRTLLDNLLTAVVGVRQDTASPHLPTIEDVLAAIEDITVEFPETPPDWYTAPTEIDLEDLADAVWHQVGSVGTIDSGTAYATRGEMLDDVHGVTSALGGLQGLDLPWSSFYRLVAGQGIQYLALNNLWSTLDTSAFPAEPDLSLWETGDTPYSFLARTQPTYGWDNVGPTGEEHDGVAWKLIGGAHGAIWLRSSFSAPQVPKEIADIVATEVTVTVNAAPVWPGLENVTLGDAESLVDQLHLTGPMDGVIIAVTTPPERVGRYLIGGATMDYGVGRIAFETDSGDLEPWQYLGFRAAIFTPKTMAHAAGVRLQVLGGAGGTVTPWTVSA